MKAAVQNIRRSSASHVSAFLLPVIVIPLAVMGVTAPKGFDAHAAAVAVEQAEGDVELCRKIRLDRERLGGDDVLDVAQEYGLALGSLVPRERTPMELYTLIREAAASSGLELTTIRSGAQDNIGLPVAETSIVMQEMYVDGAGTLVGTVLFPRALRAAGVPATTLKATIGRDRVGNARFDISLRLGVFHVVDGPGPGSDGGRDARANQEASSR